MRVGDLSSSPASLEGDATLRELVLRGGESKETMISADCGGVEVIQMDGNTYAYLAKMSLACKRLSAIKSMPCSWRFL